MSNQQRLQPSDEVDDRHLELAREAGDAYREAVDHKIEDVANTGDTREVGDYVVGFAQEEAEGLYRVDDGELTWEEPAEGENCHLEVVIASAADGRFLPEMSVHATIEDGDGETVADTDVPFLWHPGLYHYGQNLDLPGDGTYSITIEADAPTFARHDEENGDRFAEPIEETFEGVEIETGRD